MWIWPEVPRSLSLCSTHDNCSRICLVNGDRQKGIALVVAKSDIESRVVLLDERVLENKRFDFVSHLNPFD
jgi:hypothetical protein